MRAILEIKHDNSIEIIYSKGGIIRSSKYSSFLDLDASEVGNKEVIVVIPDSFLITKNLVIPWDIKSILALKSYLVKSLPVKPNDLYNDYLIIGNKVYFVGVRKELLSDCMKLLKRLKAKLRAVIPKSYVLKIACNLSHPKYVGINFDESYTSIFSFEGNGYFFFVVLPYGFASFLDVSDEIQLTKFINEVYRLVSSFQNQTKISIEEFFLIVNKEYSRLPVLSYLSKTFLGMNIITMDDGKYWDVYSKILELRGSLPVNLSIDKISHSSNKEEFLRRLENSLTFVIMGLMVFLVITFITGGNSVKRQRIILEAVKNNYNSQLSLLSSSYIQHSNVIENKSFYAYEALENLNRMSAIEVYLENFYVKDGNFYLTVVSKRYSEIVALVDGLRSSGINASIEGNVKFSVLDLYELNRAQIRIEPK
ncbi:MAG: hypothetical protein RMJ51_01340 [Candidatus Calescibacterium sp.]|nr:hypothetical protein [Candidatus Calescibacterium sp.]MDW8194875.1 hypothetical protein [Candidatus Calescibacterium sp.]